MASGWDSESDHEGGIFIASRDIEEGEEFGEVFVANWPDFGESLELYMVLGFTFSGPEVEPEPEPEPDPECVPVPCDCLPGGAAVALEGALCDCLPGGVPAQLSRSLAPYQSCPLSAEVWDNSFREWDRGSSCWGTGEESESA